MKLKPFICGLASVAALSACTGTSVDSSSSTAVSSVASSAPVIASSVAVSISSTVPISSSMPASSSTPVSSSIASSSSEAPDTELVIQENSTGFCGLNGSIDNDNEGFTGSGFANAANLVGSSITWKINVESAGNYRIDWRYANGSDSNRDGNVSVNKAAQGNVAFPTTGAWTSWTQDGATVNLNAGDNEIVLAANVDAGLPNVDSLIVIGNGISPVECKVVIDLPTNQSGIKITDQAIGWATVNGGITGGGTDLSKAVTVNSMNALKSAVSGTNSKIVLVTPGTYSGALSIGANTTLIGTAPGVIIQGNVSISGSDKKNIIVRNLAIRGDRCNTYEECKAGADAMYIGNGAQHIWLDHLDISDGQDGNCDVTKAADYVTISWTKFSYSYNKEHRFSNLIAGSDSEASEGKLNITYMNNWWADRVDQRQPRGRFGKIHMLNNYHSTKGSQIHGVGYKMAMIAENSHYEEPGLSIFKEMPSTAPESEGQGAQGWKGIGNIGSGSNLNQSKGSVFTIPYQYTAMPASSVKGAVTSSNCGAGNTCQLVQ